MLQQNSLYFNKISGHSPAHDSPLRFERLFQSSLRSRFSSREHSTYTLHMGHQSDGFAPQIRSLQCFPRSQSPSPCPRVKREDQELQRKRAQIFSNLEPKEYLEDSIFKPRTPRKLSSNHTPSDGKPQQCQGINEEQNKQQVKKEEEGDPGILQHIPQSIEEYRISIKNTNSLIASMLQKMNQIQKVSGSETQISRLHSYMMNDLYLGYYLPQAPPSEREYLIERKRDTGYFSDTKERNLSKNKPYKSYPNYIKQIIAGLSDFLGERMVKDIFDIDNKAQRRWRESGGNRRKGGGKKIQDPEVERLTLQFLEDRLRQTGHIPQMKDVQNFGQQLIALRKKSGIASQRDKFCASKGWANKLLLRFKKKAKSPDNAAKMMDIEDAMLKERLEPLSPQFVQRALQSSGWCRMKAEFERSSILQ